MGHKTLTNHIWQKNKQPVSCYGKHQKYYTAKDNIERKSIQ